MQSISTPYYKVLDLSLIFLCCSAAYWLRFNTFSIPLYYFLPTAIFATVSLPALNITNFYRETNSDISSQMSFAAAAGLVVSAVLTITCLYLTKTGQDYSRIWLATSVVFSFIALLSSRLILKRVFHVSTNPRVILLLGDDYSAEVVKEKLESTDNEGITIAKHFTFSNIDKTQQAQLLESVTDFIEQYRKNNEALNPISEVWITHNVFSKFEHISLVSVLGDSSVSLVYVPAVPRINSVNEEQIQIIAGIPTINSSFSKNEKLKQFAKFTEDQVVAWSTLILLSPLLIIISVLVKLDSPGPIIYKQLRYGFGGKAFMIWKFRTMYFDNDNQKFKQAQKDDPRVTKIGKFLRKNSLDELPQLINVIRGEMSIVGPRPHPETLNEQYRIVIGQYMQRHTLKPGITGLAQIKGFRGETSDPELMKQRIENDLDYIKTWSIWLDIKILFLTVFHLLNTDKAH